MGKESRAPRNKKSAWHFTLKKLLGGGYKTQLPLNVGGLALGFHDRNTNIAIYNTYVSPDFFDDKEINDF